MMTYIQSDPEAAETMFSFPELAEKLIMVPLDLTHSALLTKEIEQRILTSQPSKFRQMWVELGRFFAHKYATVFGITAGPPLHDVCAVHIASLVGQGVVSQKGGRWERIEGRPGERIDEFLIGDLELPHTEEVTFHRVSHYLIAFNQKPLNPVNVGLSSANTERLNKDEMLSLINNPPQEEVRE